MILAIHKNQGNKIVCVTDTTIIGKKYVEEKRQLDLTSEFYIGEEKSKEEIKQEIKNAYVIHFTGKESVALGIELDLVAAGHILTIDNIPHTETIRERD